VKRDATQVLYLDLHFPEGANAHFEQALPSQHNAMAYVYQGSVDVVCGEDTAAVPAQHLAILRNEGDHVRLSAGQGARALLLAGQPLREPIVQYGLFVMNTKEQIIAAMDDYRAGRLA
jgi:redox-sensitive bicupin YhaK (pirin superfamily)